MDKAVFFCFFVFFFSLVDMVSNIQFSIFFYNFLEYGRVDCGGDWLRGSQEKQPPLVPIDQKQAAKSTRFYLPFHTHTKRIKMEKKKEI